MQNDESRNFASFTHDHVARTIAQLDTKVGIFIGFITAALAFLSFNYDLLARLSVVVDDAYSVLNTGALAHDRHSFDSLVVVLTTALLSSAFMFCVFSLRPRVNNAVKSYVFFAGICNFVDERDYAKSVIEMKQTELTRFILEDVYFLSQIAKTKTKWARLSIWSTFFGLGLLVVCLTVVRGPVTEAPKSPVPTISITDPAPAG